MTHRRLNAILLTLLVVPVLADGPRDNIPDDVRPIPPLPEKELTAEERRSCEDAVAKLGAEIDALRTVLKDKPKFLALLPDVQIYQNAIRYPIQYHETLTLKQAQSLLADGMNRAQALRAGDAPWLATGGPRGYVSRIDGSVQPYILSVPGTYAPGSSTKFRLDLNAHGRNEKLTEAVFITAKPQPPTGHFTAYLYGRFCNANKFAGEIDLLEVLDHVKGQYPIDENRVITIGFSMGGAACWQFAVHYTDLFCAASPGAGFSETKDFLKVFQNEQVAPPWYEQTLWHWYDCTDYAVNLFNLPTVAYAGEIDKQKQASDMMEKAMAAEGLKLERLIGPNTAHKYEPQTKVELDKRLDAYSSKGRDPLPQKIRFTTWTLRYPHMFWVHAEGLEKHWTRARVDAEFSDGTITATTANVAAVRFTHPDARSVILDGQKLPAANATFIKQGGTWRAGSAGGLRKSPGLQGPIDDAFLDRFIMVLPTGKPMSEKTAQWVGKESQHAIDHWRKQFRGEAVVKKDTEITDADIRSANLVLWGDPSSNQVLARVVAKLPIKWTADNVLVGDATFPAANHIGAMIYPNPLNPNRYIVLNSGFTYREYDYLNNARQTPKLPDYAILDVNTPANSRYPAAVPLAGFFDEQWQLMKDNQRPRP